MRFDVQALPVLVAVAVQQALGFFWFVVAVKCVNWFRRIRETDAGSPTGGAVWVQLVSVACSAVAALALAVVVRSLDRVSVGDGLLAGLVAGVGFTGSGMVMNATYEGRDPVGTWSFVAYQIVSLSAMGGILAAWG